jgi:hypothetical protein
VTEGEQDRAKVATQRPIECDQVGDIGELANLTNGDSGTWTVGRALHLPILDGGRNRANLSAAAARYDQAEAMYRRVILTAFREVEDALSDLNTLSRETRPLMNPSRRLARLPPSRTSDTNAASPIISTWWMCSVLCSTSSAPKNSFTASKQRLPFSWSKRGWRLANRPASETRFVIALLILAEPIRIRFPFSL